MISWIAFYIRVSLFMCVVFVKSFGTVMGKGASSTLLLNIWLNDFHCTLRTTPSIPSAIVRCQNIWKIMFWRACRIFVTCPFLPFWFWAKVMMKKKCNFWNYHQFFRKCFLKILYTLESKNSQNSQRPHPPVIQYYMDIDF